MWFEIIGDVAAVENIATGRGIREISRLKKVYGPGRWRKMKGTASVRLSGGETRTAELHWYEAHGRGRCELKVKRLWKDK